MKKGDLRRQEILNTAESLFLTRGYAQTSVQDVLDAMSLSKGGFYHHFDTKMALLSAISQRRCEAQFDQSVREILRSRFDPTEKLNRVLALVNMFEREDPVYIRMLLDVCYMGGDMAALNRAREVTTRLIVPALTEILLDGMRTGAFYVRRPDQTAHLLALLAQDLNDSAARILCDGRGNPECVLDVLDLLNTYRDSVETLVGAAYGSVCLFDVERVLRVLRTALEGLAPANQEE